MLALDKKNTATVALVISKVLQCSFKGAMYFRVILWGSECQKTKTKFLKKRILNI